MKKLMISLSIVLMMLSCTGEKKESGNRSGDYMDEHWRPQVHFSPESQWMNDPNGMVYHEGEYHLFYQYNPDSTVWGPMHWGHAISKDLLHWEHQPIALYPDSLGTIFSGSAVADVNNTSGFGKDGEIPLVAIYTNHSHEKEAKGDIDYQTQSIAYSLDNGRTWEKYDGNPVLNNPGIRDFRDPKVIWHKDREVWIMALAVKDRVSFYSSPDLKTWAFESDFGGGVDHGGVVECPDLFPMTTPAGKEKWVLLVSLNPGAPNGGSGTKYYVGDFDGTEFSSDWPAEKEMWLDFGKDNYAGVTWSNVPDENGSRLFIGWMSNWQYANVVPTEKWRSSNTLPRKLTLKEDASGNLFLQSEFAETLDKIASEWKKGNEFTVNPEEFPAYQLKMNVETNESSLFEIALKNSKGDKAVFTFDLEKDLLTFDRSNSGQTAFHENFIDLITAPIDFGLITEVGMVVDQSSIELLVNGGRLQMTNLVFPQELLNNVEVVESAQTKVLSSQVRGLKSIWK